MDTYGHTRRIAGCTVDTRWIHGRYTVDTRTSHGGYTADIRQIQGRYTVDTRSIHGGLTVLPQPGWWSPRQNSKCTMYRLRIDYVWSMYRVKSPIGRANTAPSSGSRRRRSRQPRWVAASQLTPNDGRGLAPPLLQRSATAARGPIHASFTNRSAAVSKAEPAAPAPTGGRCHHASRRDPGPAPAGSDGCRGLQSARALR